MITQGKTIRFTRKQDSHVSSEVVLSARKFEEALSALYLETNKMLLEVLKSKCEQKQEKLGSVVAMAWY